MFERVEVDYPKLTEVGNRFLGTGEFLSMFFRPKAPTATYPNFDRGFQAVLADVVQSDFIGEAFPQLVPLNVPAAMKFARLDRYEFEGSLVSVLLEGTCTERVVSGEGEAREVVQSIFRSAFRPDGGLWAWRLDDWSWSTLTKGATVAWAYFVYESSQRIWWFVCFADHY